MKTAQIKQWRTNHHRSLELLAQEVGCQKSGLKLWRELSRIERDTTRITTMACNGDVSQEALDRFCDRALHRVAKAFGGTLPAGIFINRDPRGYALKLDSDVRPIPEGMTKDWGNYGLLAAVIE